MSASQPLSAAALAGLACPACGADLAADGASIACQGCGRGFGVVAGIPDLRLSYDDPYLSWEEDLERARELAEASAELDFSGLLREHWIRSGTPVALSERFVAGDLASLERSRSYLDRVARERGASLGADDRLLEIGCGTAGLAAVAAAGAGEVVASDASMRWLVLARKRLAEDGVEGVRLVCCAAEHPPFERERFDVVVAGDVIEHVGSQDGFAAGCDRVLRPGGMLFLATPNRFSITLEPHVRLWGVGFLPRGAAKAYVRAVRRAPYEHVRLLSARGLRRLLTRHGFQVKVVAPEIPAATAGMYRGAERRLVGAYNRLRRLAAVHRALLVAGPFFHVFATKPPD